MISRFPPFAAHGYNHFSDSPVMDDRINIVEADITDLEVDAIVNAANPTLLGGGGVDGAIHRSAGPGLLEACRALSEVEPGVRCPTGEARITPGFDLPARWVIHTAGPIWKGGKVGEAELLSACYRNSLELATDPSYGIASIAFPSISTGAYGYPLEQAANIAVKEVREFLESNATLEAVRFVCFGREAYESYRLALGKY